ncbi:MAG: class I SAM-dependent methyltransferase [Leptonema sp. (in: bacteria)]
MKAKNFLIKFLNKIDDTRVSFGFEIQFPDSTKYIFEDHPIHFKIFFKNEESLNDFVSRGNMAFAEHYIAQNIEIEGDFYYIAYLGLLIEQQGLKPNLWEKLKIFYHFLTHKNTLKGSKKNISHHYDLGNDFYSLWLDKNMQYTCAYFKTPKDTLEEAQIQKMDLICKKLQFKKNDFVVEAGCGWGGFAIYAVKNYGIKMRAYNISKEQIEYAKEWQKKEKIPESQLEFILDDFRNIAKDANTYDKFVSVGMLEHLGVENYETLFDIIYKKIHQKGLALIHTISRAYPKMQDPWVNKYIFPGGYIPSLGEIIVPLEKYIKSSKTPNYFYIMDIENLKYHYALTLDRWSERFEKNVKTIRKKYGESFVRMFRMYLRGSSSGFREGELTLLQIILQKNTNPNYPLTRSHFLIENKTKV